MILLRCLSIRFRIVSVAIGVTLSAAAWGADAAESTAPSREEAVVLTPKPPATPRINGARVFGVRPGHPFLFTIPATGQRPMTFAVEGLPEGLKVDPQSGRITGSLKMRGDYPVTFRVTNALGQAERNFKITCGNTLALTPHMGWNSWYIWEYRVTDKIMRDAADAMVSTGMIDHGWTYVNIDDCWAVMPGSKDPGRGGEPRDAQGNVNSTPRFPDMKALADYIHDKGLKAGLYTSPGPLTCCGNVGAYQHEEQDARRFADWGFDFLKYDWCSYGDIAKKDPDLAALQKPYRLMGRIVQKLDRDVVLNFCQYGMGDVWKWGRETGGHSWRTAGDLGLSFEGIPAALFRDAFALYGRNELQKYSAPGAWNDPDYLLLGYLSNWKGGTAPTPLSPNEQYAHMSLWCLLAAPLILSGDITRLDDFTLSLLTNDEVLDVDQDPLGKSALRVAKNGDHEVWAKDMEDGSKAVGLFNRGEGDASVAVKWSDLGLQGKQTVRDLWRQKDLGEYENAFSATVGRHGVVLIRIQPVKPRIAANAAVPATPDNAVSLAGQWSIRLDPEKIGIEKKWFTGALPPGPAGLAGKRRLPGSTDEHGLGTPNQAKPTLNGLYRRFSYEGRAWYQRDVDIPPAWHGKRVQLSLERVHWETRVWLDDQDFGVQDSLIAPHLYDLGATLSPGKHRLTICVDNTRKIDLGLIPHIYYEGTQTNWNGLIGRLELRTVSPVAIEDVQVFPDVDRKLARVRLTVANVTGTPAEGTVTLTATDRQSGRKTAPVTLKLVAAQRQTTLSAELPMGDDVRLWDEFSPSLYDLAVTLSATQGGAPSAESRSVTFGMRKFDRRGTQFTVNDRPVFLRGPLECAIFPLTGYPPTDEASWRRIYRIIKSYGMNHMRFHAWCPPEAAMTAADLEGVMLQVEAPQANIDAGKDPKRDAFIEQEILRIVRAYGNHPSFCLMTLGNEYAGPDALLSRWVDMLKREDPRHLYSSPSCGQMTANRQFTEVSPRGIGIATDIHGPRTDADFRVEIAKEDRPLVAHEIGQWTFYPNFDEIKKYRGVLTARNFELIRDDLAAKHLLDLAPRFFQATGKHALLIYKESIEAMLRTPGCAGFNLLDLRDYPGQGTALVGPLDPFWDSKGLVTPDAYRCFCSPIVPLLRMAKRTFTIDEPFTALAEVANFGPRDLSRVDSRWTIKDQQGREVAAGSMPSLGAPTGKLTSLGRLTASLAKAAAPCKLTVSLSLHDTACTNDWEIWVFPPSRPVATPADVTVATQWDEAKNLLANGKSVVLFPATVNSAHSLPGSFRPVFWSPIWTSSQIPCTMGILCDPKHPALAHFPTEFHSNWQWYDLIQNSRTLILGDTPADFRPIVQVIDNFARNQKLGNVFETRVGPGRLLVCTIDLPGIVDKQPAARQFLASLYAYATSDQFKPACELNAKLLDRLFASPP
jgi:hypothetical protein